jgi:hypothetical protein
MLDAFSIKKYYISQQVCVDYSSHSSWTENAGAVACKNPPNGFMKNSPNGLVSGTISKASSRPHCEISHQPVVFIG